MAPHSAPKAAVEHRWPKKRRSSYPQMFALWYSWRRVMFFTPKVGVRAWQIVVTILPKSGWLVGVYVYRDEDDEWIVRLGIGVVDVEINTLHFLPESYWADMEARTSDG
jgi:hypothetical protein